MVKLVYSLCHFIIRYSGIAGLFRLFLARNNVSVVLYHNPKPDIFEKHLKYLSKRYNLISLSDFSHAFFLKRLENIPKYALVITLDDGWKENYQLIRVIKQYKFRPTIFLASHIINTERHFWWTACPVKDINRLKFLPEHQRLSEMKEKYQFYPDKEYRGDRQALNLSEIEEMKEYVDFSLHTRFHSILTRCSREEKRIEITECKFEMERILGNQIDTFSYPNGDYDEDCIELLKECGLKIARTTDAGWNNQGSDPLKLKVTGVSDHGSLNKLIAELTGIPMYFQYFFKGSLNGIKK